MYIDPSGKVWASKKDAIEYYQKHHDTTEQWAESCPPLMWGTFVLSLPLAIYGIRTKNVGCVALSAGCLAMLVAHRLSYFDSNPLQHVHAPKSGGRNKK
jgi:hypothetical protein